MLHDTLLHSPLDAPWIGYPKTCSTWTGVTKAELSQRSGQTSLRSLQVKFHLHIVGFDRTVALKPIMFVGITANQIYLLLFNTVRSKWNYVLSRHKWPRFRFLNVQTNKTSKRLHELSDWALNKHFPKPWAFPKDSVYTKPRGKTHFLSLSARSTSTCLMKSKWDLVMKESE